MASTVYFLLFTGFIIAIIQPITSESAYEWDVERSSVNPLSYTDDTHYSRHRTSERPVLQFSIRGARCPENEHVTLCYAHCQRTCDNYKNPIPCPRIRKCIRGCICDKGFVRGPDDKCIKPEDCPAKPNAEAQHLYVTLNPPPYTDDDYHIPDSVTKNPQFEETEIPPISQAEPSHKCPDVLERYVPCSAHCQRNCTNKDDKDFRCRPVCIPGCMCKEGLVKGPNGKCIDKYYCPRKLDSERNDDFKAGHNPCPDHEACRKLCRKINEKKTGECVGPNYMTCHCHE